MNIKILKNIDCLSGSTLSDNLLLESKKEFSEYNGITKFIYSIYNLDTNERYEVLPEINKYNIGKIENVSAKSDYIYFFNVYSDSEANNNANINEHINILRYDYVNKLTESIYSFDDKIEKYECAKHLHVFVINDQYMIIQNEYLKENNAKTYAGYFDFELKFYNIKEEAEYPILDENFTHNGIENIVSVSDNQVAIKTGYSLLADNRYNELENDEASLENISFVNIGQLVSDLAIGNVNIVTDSIDQAFYTKTFPYMIKNQNYIIYSCVNFETKEETVVFFNYITKEKSMFTSNNVIRTTDLTKTYILADIPFVLKQKEKKYEFINVNTNKSEILFKTESLLTNVVNDTFLFSGKTHNTLFKKSKPCFDIYAYPGKKHILHENNEFLGCLATNSDNLYIFVK